ncbi:MAG: polysaccharide deacetylase family protein [Prevotellaceae bacterium]|jgi:peptidoglycan/xylan/chitin deacetylase (PgdA/CDA1 family)|nr:polysaccharide deacetylase family protein [Prevotellaceae bacterium]
MYFRPPKLLKRLFPSLIWNFPEEEVGRTIFLTFDDGPTPEVTPRVLDTLDKYEAKATFFCLGKNVEQHPEVYNEIRGRGHAVGSHSYSHQKGWGMSLSRYIEDYNFSDSFIETNLIRPPYGRITPRQAKVLSERYKIIMWDVLTHDYSRTVSRKGCLKAVTKHARPGSIIVFHDSKKAEKNLIYALPRALEFLKKEGYECRRIEL